MDYLDYERILVQQRAIKNEIVTAQNHYANEFARVRTDIYNLTDNKNRTAIHAEIKDMEIPKEMIKYLKDPYGVYSRWDWDKQHVTAVDWDNVTDVDVSEDWDTGEDGYFNIESIEVRYANSDVSSERVYRNFPYQFLDTHWTDFIIAKIDLLIKNAKRREAKVARDKKKTTELATYEKLHQKYGTKENSIGA